MIRDADSASGEVDGRGRPADDWTMPNYIVP